MHPKFILVSRPDKPLVGTFVYGLVFQHKDLVDGYVKVHGGGWYLKDDEKKTMTLYGEPRLSFLNRIPKELRDYTFYYTPGWNLPGNALDLTDVEWF